MRNWMRSSRGCANCRLEWRPSRWVIGGVGLVTVLAPLSILASDLAHPFDAVAAASAVSWGLASALREAHRRPRQVLVPADPAQPLRVDDVAVDEGVVSWRGHIAVVAWRDAVGRRRRLIWWPDTLPRPMRRELRLAAMARQGTRRPRTMAP